MLNITGQQGNASENHYEVSAQNCQNGHHQKTQITNVGGNVWWEYKLGRPLWRTVWKLLKKLKIELSHNLAILLLGMYVKKKKKPNQ